MGMADWGLDRGLVAGRAARGAPRGWPGSGSWVGYEVYRKLDGGGGVARLAAPLCVTRHRECGATINDAIDAAIDDAIDGAIGAWRCYCAKN